jgi:hypothetical protein
MSTRTGTSYFASLSAALRYYKSYGLNRAHVFCKLADGEIHIGVPPLKRGESYTLDAVEGRYTIVSETPPPPPIKKSPSLKAHKAHIYRTVGKRQGNIRDVLVAQCMIAGNGRAQAYRNARLFAAAWLLLDACRVALPAAEDADDDELADQLRAAIEAAGEQQ